MHGGWGVTTAGGAIPEAGNRALAADILSCHFAEKSELRRAK